MKNKIQNIKLKIPQEPEEVRRWIRNMEVHFGPSTPDASWDSLNVWYGNQLPKYLWDAWKEDLKPEGFTWQKFLKLLTRRTDTVLLWYKGALSWGKFIESITDLIKGPLGQELAKK